jgi:hypothetical protein
VPTFVHYHAVSVAVEKGKQICTVVSSHKPQLPCPKCHERYEPKALIPHKQIWYYRESEEAGNCEDSGNKKEDKNVMKTGFID